MPANKKHLSSGLQRFAKITAGLLGGYLVTITFHLILAQWLDQVNVIITMTFTGFIMWCGLMIVAFMSRNGWKVWGLYLGISLLLSIGIYLTQNHLTNLGS